MTAQEYEQFLHDAEVKLARLKSLYEQWFQGIERTEPVIARKDLDRTLELLKKNMPRNTALRFRTQQLSARYGTYGIYWGRIGRQIEEGTYKRVLARAGRTNVNGLLPSKRDESGWEIDVDIDEVESSPIASRSPGPLADGDLDAILGSFTAEEKTKTKPTRSLSPFGFGAGLAGARGPTASTTSRAASPPASPTTTRASPTTTPTSPTTTPASPTTTAARAPAPTPAPTTSSASFGKPVDGPSRKPPLVAAAPMVASVSASMPKPKDGPTPAMPAPPIARLVPPPPGAPPPPPPARPVAAPVNSSLGEGRMRAIHASFVDARRKNNEGAEVRYEALAESVEKMIPKLREKHGGKPIDFEVVVQNGKVGLKPKVDG